MFIYLIRMKFLLIKYIILRDFFHTWFVQSITTEGIVRRDLHIENWINDRKIPKINNMANTLSLWKAQWNTSFPHLLSPISCCLWYWCLSLRVSPSCFSTPVLLLLPSLAQMSPFSAFSLSISCCVKWFKLKIC